MDSNENTVLVSNTVVVDNGENAGLGAGPIILLVILVLVLLGGIATGIYFLVRTVKKTKAKKKAKKAAQAMPQQTQPVHTTSTVTGPTTIPGYVAPETKKLPWFIRVFVPKKKGIPSVTHAMPQTPSGPAPPPPRPPPRPPPTPRPAPRPAPAPTPPAGPTTWTDTTPLPLPFPLSKKGAPWYILDTDNPKAMSLSDGAFKFSYTKGKTGSKSGGSFKANPFKKLPADACTLSFSVFFPAGFNYRKGGKLPGVCLGTSQNDCANGKEWSANTGSFRLTFKEDGAAVGYAYMAIAGGSKPAWDMQGSRYKAATKKDRPDGTDAPGHHMWHDSGLKFKSGSWNVVSLQIALNTPGKMDGRASLTVNGKTETMTDVVWRTSSSVKIQNVNFVSFFGGSGPEAASLVDTYSLIKDVRYGVGKP